MRIKHGTVRTLGASLVLALASIPSLVRAEGLNPSDTPQPWVFGGLDLGLASTTANVAGESNKSGYQLNLKVLLSQYWAKWVADLGVGWQYNRIEGSMSPFPPVRITTRAGFAELGGRYRLTQRWSVGPALNYVFGTDPTFAPSINREARQAALLFGAQVHYEIPQDTWMIRVGARAMTDVNIENRQLYLLQGVIQFGIPVRGTRARAAEPTPPPPAPLAEVIPPPAPEPMPIPPPPPPAVEESKPDVKIDLGTRFIYFDTDKAKVKPATRKALQQLGKFLAQNGDQWDRLQIDGHTDHRGTNAHNLKLSRDRAKAVRQALISGGVPASKIEARGWSFKRPRTKSNSPKAWAFNRRVEFRFFGVRDPKLIQNGLEEAKRNLKKAAE